MGVVKAVTEVVEEIGLSAVAFLGGSASRYCQIETRDSEQTLAANDGSLVSIIEIGGFMVERSGQEIEVALNGIIQAIRSSSTQPGICYSFWFMSDKASARYEIDQMQQASRQTASRIQLSANEIIESKVNKLASLCVSEHAYLAIWTTPARLSRLDIKNDAAEMNKNRPPLDLNIMGQSPLMAIASLRDMHASDVLQMSGAMTDIGLINRVLDAHDAVAVVKASIESDFSNDTWRASLLGDKLEVHESTRRENTDFITARDYGYQPIWEQLFTEPVQRLGQFVKYKGRTYAFIHVDRHPSQKRPFSQLKTRLRESGVPWRASFNVESGGMTFGSSVKEAVSGILSWASSANIYITQAFEELKARVDHSNDPPLRFRMCFATWVEGDDLKTLRANLSKLERTLESWGMAQVSSVPGDPIAAFSATACGLTRNNVGTACYVNADEIVRMLPIDTAGSPWENGSVIFRTLDGQIIPFEPSSSLQNSRNYVGYGTPGTGKSVMASTILRAVTLSGGLQRLPRIAITDIGPSSVGFVMATKDMLPQHMQHLCAAFRLTMDEKYSTNPCDTHLGLDTILPDDKGFLVSLCTLLVTPPESGQPYDSMADLVSAVIDVMYSNSARGSLEAKMYSPGRDRGVDAYLENKGLDYVGRTWWEVVDYLFSQEEDHLARLAQRFAVPTLEDSIRAARDPSIEDLYGGENGPITRTGESLNKAFGRLMADALKNYPILTRPTVFDIGDARIVSIDIDAVAPKGSPSNDKQTCVMYMLASFIMTREWRMSSEAQALAATLERFPEQYRAYTRKRILDIAEDKKIDVADEFRRISSCKSAAPVIEDFITRSRESRKWGRDQILLSQDIDDFPEELLKMTTGVFALEAGPTSSINRLRDIFKVSETSIRELERHGHGPARDGSGTPFLGIFKLKTGVFSRMLVNTISALEIWSYATDKEDRLIRGGVFERLGPEEGRQALVARFPTGSAKKEYERLGGKAGDDGDDVDDGLIARLINEAVDHWRARR